MLDKVKIFFRDWYSGSFFIVMGIVVMVTIYINRNNQEFITSMQKTLTYDFAVFLLGVCVASCGLIVLSEPISKQLWKSARVRQWYIAYKAKQDLRRKRDVR